jgi:hypothetical protein
MFYSSIPGGAGNRVQNGSGTHPAYYTMGTKGSLPGGKAAGARSYPFNSPIHVHGAELKRSTETTLPLPLVSKIINIVYCRIYFETKRH